MKNGPREWEGFSVSFVKIKSPLVNICRGERDALARQDVLLGRRAVLREKSASGRHPRVEVVIYFVRGRNWATIIQRSQIREKNQ